MGQSEFSSEELNFQNNGRLVVLSLDKHFCQFHTLVGAVAENSRFLNSFVMALIAPHNVVIGRIDVKC